MITIKIELEGDKKIKSIFSQGHAQNGNNKHNMSLCAAVSTLEYTFLQCVKHLLTAQIEVDIGEGIFKYRLGQLDLKDKKVYNYLCVFYLIGIEMLAKENSQSMRLLKTKSSERMIKDN